jgi:hypothetical protein
MDGMSKGPMPAEAMPQGAAKPAMAPKGGEDPVKQLVTGLAQGMGMLAKLLEQTGNAPGAGKIMDMIGDMQELVLSGGEAPEAEDKAVPMQGNADMNAGAKKVLPVM